MIIKFLMDYLSKFATITLLFWWCYIHTILNWKCMQVLIPLSLKTYIINFEFYPKPVWALEYCRCLHLSVCLCVWVHEHQPWDSSCYITHHPFKLGSPNLAQWCKTSWLRSLCLFFVVFLCVGGWVEVWGVTTIPQTPSSACVTCSTRFECSLWYSWSQCSHECSWKACWCHWLSPEMVCFLSVW